VAKALEIGQIFDQVDFLLKLNPYREAYMKSVLQETAHWVFRLALLLTTSAAFATEVRAPNAEKNHKLIIMLPIDENGLSPERLVSYSSVAPLTALTQLNIHRFGNPIAARYLIKDRLSVEARSRLGSEDPLVHLQRYVVLDYKSQTDKDLARRLISLERDVLAFESHDTPYSSVPSDPLYQQGVAGGVNITSQRTAYQTLMNVESAWDAVQGNAYVAVVDSGIDASHPDLIANMRPHFSKNHSTERIRALRRYALGDNDPAAEYLIMPDSTVGPCSYAASQPEYPSCRGYYDPNFQSSRQLRADEWGDFRSSGGYRTYGSPFAPPGSSTNFILDFDQMSRGHGTHVAGILSAKGGNGTGGIGICWHCSVMSQRASSSESWINAVIEAVNNGAQVINYSGGLPIPSGVDYCPNGNSNDPSCGAIFYANSKNAQLVASSGNYPDVSSTQFPAMSALVVSVGSVDRLGNPSSFSANSKVDFFAPGERILSSFVQGGRWSLNLAGPNTDCAANPGEIYAHCTGTSFSSPMISGAMALLRTADPLLSNTQTKNLLTSFVGSNGKPLLPNVAASMTKALSVTNGNRGMTPLFTMFSNGTQAYFSTSVPQMASAASCGTMRAGLSGIRAPRYLSAKGDSVAHLAAKYPQTFNAYPQTLNAPTLLQSCMPANTPLLASSMVFTTISRGGVGLIPIYRLSYVDTIDLAATINHIYTTSASEQGIFTTWGYAPDGAEGWVYPPNAPQPAGTIPLLRRWKYDLRVNEGVSRYVAAIFPANLAAAYAAEGYSTILYQGTLGYVCPVLGQTGVCAAPYTP
jgi:Subtilase family